MCRLLYVLLSVACVFAQGSANSARSERFNHVHWALKLDQASAAPDTAVLARLEATIDPEWHMYSLTTPPGPIRTVINVKDSPAVETITVYEPPPVRRFDPNFNADTETYEGKQIFLIRIQLNKDLGPVSLTFVPRYQTCSGTQCIPPRERILTAMLNIVARAPVAAITIPADYIETKPDSSPW